MAIIGHFRVPPTLNFCTYQYPFLIGYKYYKCILFPPKCDLALTLSPNPDLKQNWMNGFINMRTTCESIRFALCNLDNFANLSKLRFKNLRNNHPYMRYKHIRKWPQLCDVITFANCDMDRFKTVRALLFANNLRHDCYRKHTRPCHTVSRYLRD